LISDLDPHPAQFQNVAGEIVSVHGDYLIYRKVRYYGSVALAKADTKPQRNYFVRVVSWNGGEIEIEAVKQKDFEHATGVVVKTKRPAPA